MTADLAGILAAASDPGERLAGGWLRITTARPDRYQTWLSLCAKGKPERGLEILSARGLTEEHMPAVAEWIDRAVTAADDEPALDKIAGEVRELLAGFPMPGWGPAA